jgi:hypothetical protein
LRYAGEEDTISAIDAYEDQKPTSRIMQPLEAAVFATIFCKMNLNPDRAFPIRF